MGNGRWFDPVHHTDWVRPADHFDGQAKMLDRYENKDRLYPVSGDCDLYDFYPVRIYRSGVCFGKLLHHTTAGAWEARRLVCDTPAC